MLILQVFKHILGRVGASFRFLCLWTAVGSGGVLYMRVRGCFGLYLFALFSFQSSVLVLVMIMSIEDFTGYNTS